MWHFASQAWPQPERSLPHFEAQVGIGSSQVRRGGTGREERGLEPQGQVVTIEGESGQVCCVVEVEEECG